MRLSTILKVIAILIVAIIVGGVVVVMNIDFNQYKDLIASKVKEATGRTLVIDGDIELELSFTPSLAVSGVKFQNAEWGSRPNMAEIDRFSAQVALMPLLTKTVEVQHVLLSGAEILIERDAKGRANFIFDKAAATGESEKQSDAKAPSEAPEGLPIPVVRKVLIEDAKLTYIDAVSGQNRVLELDKVSLAGLGPDAPVEMSFAMSVDGQSISGDGQLGALAGLTDPAVAWPLKLTMSAGGAKISVGGKIQDPVGVSGLDLTLDISGETLATLSPLAGAPIPPIGPYSVSTKVRGNLATSVELVDIAVKVGKSDIGGSVKAALGGARPTIDGTFKSTLVDLSDFQPAESDESTPKEAEKKQEDPSAEAASSEKSGRVLPDTPLPVEALKIADAKIAYGAKRILAKGAALENLNVGVSLRDGRLNVSPLKAELAKGTIDGRVKLDGARATPALDMAVKVLSLDLGKLLTDADVTDLLEGSINVDVNLNGSGGTVRSLAAGLNGQVKALMDEGRVKTTALDAFIGGPTQVVTKMVTGDKKEFTVLNCVVSQTDIKKGVATLTATVIDTEYARITGKGNVNLGTEAIAVVVNPEPKSATLNLAVAVKVGGTLANPSYGLDELSVLRKLGGAVLGVGFPPALLLGMGELGADGDNPCLKPSASSGGKSAPAKSEKSNPVSKGIEGAGNLLKGLFGK